MNIRILWQTPCGPGHLELRGGTLAGSPHIPEEATSLDAEIQDAQIAPGDFPTLVRVITALLIIPGGMSIWVYLIAALIIPKKSKVYPGF